jgi:hypothetical protein
MISKIIIKTYLKNFFKNWFICSFLIIFFQTLFHYLKEIKLISLKYSHYELLKYLSGMSLLEFFGLAPLTIFIAIVITNTQWTQQRLWLACSVIGSSKAQFFFLTLIQLCLLTLITLPGYLFIAPKIGFKVSLDRLECLDKIPHISIGSTYLQDHQLFYPISKDETFIYNFKTQQASIEQWNQETPLISKSNSGTLDLNWILYEQLGLNKLSFNEKRTLLKQIAPKTSHFNDLHAVFIADLNYIVLIVLSVILGWKSAPIQAILRNASRSKIKIASHFILLYSGLKILGPATTLLPLQYVLMAYFCAILLSLLQRPSPQS